MAQIFSVWIINKAGGLIFFRDFPNASQCKLTSNDALVIASTLQSVHAITGNLFGDSNGFTMITYKAAFNMHCYATPTGLKFMLTCPTKLAPSEAQTILKRIYELYADYALKNYLYTPEMPVRCEQFDQQLGRLIK